jgi:V/A-type H+-transporting ATPase subunit E
MSVDGICDRIIADANEEAEKIIHDAEREAESIREKGKREAQQYYEKQQFLLNEKYRRDKERSILNKRLDERKNLLLARQKWMDRAFEEAYRKLVEQPSGEYEKLLVNLVQKVSATRDEEAVFGKKGDEAFLKNVIEKLNFEGGRFTLSSQRGAFPWGFILRKERVEINMSIDSLFRYKRTDLEQKAWEIFHAGE